LVGSLSAELFSSTNYLAFFTISGHALFLPKIAWIKTERGETKFRRIVVRRFQFATDPKLLIETQPSVEEDSNLVTFTITRQTLVPIVSATGSVVSAILTVVLIFLDELLFVPLLALAVIVLGHLASWVTLSAEAGGSSRFGWRHSRLLLTYFVCHPRSPSSPLDSQNRNENADHFGPFFPVLFCDRFAMRRIRTRLSVYL
jgi:hypothetical protein